MARTVGTSEIHYRVIGGGVHRTLADWYVLEYPTQAEVLCLYKQGLPGLQLRFIYFFLLFSVAAFHLPPDPQARYQRKHLLYPFLIGANISLFSYQHVCD